MWSLPISVMVVTTILAIPMSRYMAWIMNGQYTPPRFFAWFEKRLDSGPQTWQQYAAALLIFNGAVNWIRIIKMCCSACGHALKT